MTSLIPKQKLRVFIQTTFKHKHKSGFNVSVADTRWWRMIGCRILWRQAILDIVGLCYSLIR